VADRLCTRTHHVRPARPRRLVPPDSCFFTQSCLLPCNANFPSPNTPYAVLQTPPSTYLVHLPPSSHNPPQPPPCTPTPPFFVPDPAVARRLDSGAGVPTLQVHPSHWHEEPEHRGAPGLQDHPLCSYSSCRGALFCRPTASADPRLITLFFVYQPIIRRFSLTKRQFTSGQSDT